MDSNFGNLGEKQKTILKDNILFDTLIEANPLQPFKLIILVTILLTILSTPLSAEEVQKTQPRIFNINRFQYRLSFNGESVFAQSTFVLFPNKFFIVELTELITPIEENNLVNFENIYHETNIGRPFLPEYDWGRTLGWVGRIQASNKGKTFLSLGTQFNISDIPGFDEYSGKLRWKSFVQIFFLKNTKDAGEFDLFHYYQFPLLIEKLEVRGVNAYYYINDEKDFFYLMQDLIYSISKTWDIYFRHSYQNREGFQHRSDGSQFGIGIRYNFSL